jgi:hypothetical protein
MTQAFNLSQLANKVNSSGLLDVATGVTGTQAVANGGTGQSTYTNGQLLIGNTTGNTLTKTTLTAGTGISVTNGAGSITIANTAGGQFQTELFTAPGIWTNPGSVTKVRVTVVGGGGGGGAVPAISGNGQPGGGGGIAIANFTIPTSPVTITVGAGGVGRAGATPGSGGNTSSFGPYLSATGGSLGGNGPGPTVPATPGAGTISAPIIPGAIKQSNTATLSVTSLGMLYGTNTSSPGTPAITYSYTSDAIAGARGPGGSSGNGVGGTGGAIVVEFVG